MKLFFKRNIDAKGRRVRGFIALGLFIGAAVAFRTSTILGFIFIGSGVFVSFEALRGWCAFRACGINTKL
jgi:hypothetical protein